MSGAIVPRDKGPTMIIGTEVGKTHMYGEWKTWGVKFKETVGKL